MTRGSSIIAVSLVTLVLVVGAWASESAAQGDLTFLLGNWVRPDGGYTITIRSVDNSGKIQASYANPRPLPFSKAEVSREGKAVKLFFELRAEGYNGSTYRLTYDPASDHLVGIYYQAVQRKDFEVVFQRAK
jgi:uncharacterized protein (DUF2147 family)